jgi:hypothetical protein
MLRIITLNVRYAASQNVMPERRTAAKALFATAVKLL